MRRLGVLGTMVWDTIHGRDPAAGVVEEWGGIAYSLAALDATLSDDWQIVPLIKVGRDLAPQAQAFWQTIGRRMADGRFITVPQPNNRVTLHYQSAERRSERLQVGVAPALAAPRRPAGRPESGERFQARGTGRLRARHADSGD